MRVVVTGQAGADIEELPDPRLTGQVPGKRAIAPGLVRERNSGIAGSQPLGVLFTALFARNNTPKPGTAPKGRGMLLFGAIRVEAVGSWLGGP